ncbi:UDP-glucose 4-epimerase GalE [Escherichia coli]|uniref:UDP-glucose 4-epimerase GalE n=1 Tax=Escherichia coli TaxID=562 RepID=UPI000543FE28|nr:UDP-glucose 4-epimerase GalE [Escherichia coli]EET7734695.1 UDP-glucose 4-epimerase GalE [Escherichia coli]EEZ8672641.1 UDP-glucose 4-epimerase GalE [Escherichia coli]EFB2465048.1 UDP-glucose 4-epimerase GalE [Escherichia coli]EFC4806615.1 UDP-glucose 4-epimerase GalE [Escherichia coli]EFC6616394.1 UDP-glucose 4-epimerase GalE [Escherichia coli]
MNILVTGGAGYIGSHTVLRLLENENEITVVDNLVNSSSEVIKRVENITQKSICFIEMDILNTELLHEVIINKDIDAVIHFAGLKSVSESISRPLEYYNNNVQGTISVLSAMINSKAKKIIFSSSATVYGEPEQIPLNEKCKVGGTTNPYGTSKLMAEQILCDFAKANYGFDIISLRYFNPVGAHPSGMIGEAPNGIPNNLVPYLTKVAIGELDSLKIFGNDYPTRDGYGVRDFIHVMDLADGHIAALNAEFKENSIRIYNLGTGKGYSVLELVDTFERIIARKINKCVISRRDGDIAECWSDPMLAFNELGWSAKFNLEDMLRDSWNWQIKNPKGYDQNKGRK